jgi:hypothetical protein
MPTTPVREELTTATNLINVSLEASLGRQWTVCLSSLSFYVALKELTGVDHTSVSTPKQT